MKVWDTTTGKELLTYRGHGGRVWDVAFTPDGRHLASASDASASDDHTVQIWNASTGEEVFTLYGHTAQVYSVSFRPDGKRLATGSRDGTVKVWDTTTWGLDKR